MTVFKAVPWVDLIVAAPAAARSAKRLWTGIRNRRGEDAAVDPESDDARLAAIEAQVRGLRQELDACSEIIKAMTEQQTRLVEAVGILRARIRVLLAVSLILAVLSVILAFRVWG